MDGYGYNAVVVGGHCWATALFGLLRVLSMTNLLLLGMVELLLGVAALLLGVDMTRQMLLPLQRG